MKGNPLEKKDYHSYLQSDDWRELKKRYLSSKLPKSCYGCFKPYGTYRVEFHHRTYKRLGCERLLDIVPVCRSCHEKMHNEHSLGRTLWDSTNKIARRARKKPSLPYPP